MNKTCLYQYLPSDGSVEKAYTASLTYATPFLPPSLPHPIPHPPSPTYPPRSRETRHGSRTYPQWLCGA